MPDLIHRNVTVEGAAALLASEVDVGVVAAEPSILVISRVTEPGSVYGTLTGGDPDVFVSFSLAQGGEPEHGTVTVDPGGFYTYTPDPDHEGTDRFTFEVTNGTGETATTSVAITVAAEAPLVIDGSEDNDVLIGGTGDNIINGLGGRDQLVGGLGDDHLTLDDGGIAEGGEGNDTLTGGTGFNLLSGGDGDDTLSLGEGSGALFGEAGSDTLIGGLGGDYLNGGAGSDRITAGAGNDSVVLQDLDAADFIDGGEGTDMLTLDGSTTADPIVLVDGELFVAGLLVGTGFETFTITAGLSNDTLKGGAGSDSLFGGIGSDQITAGAGNDSVGLHDLDTGDFVDGGGGTDVLSVYGRNTKGPIGLTDGQLFLNGVLVGTGFENFTITAGSDNDTLTGSSGGDAFYGGGGNDTLSVTGDSSRAFGEAGNDTLTGGEGSNYLYGGEGDDALSLGGEFGAAFGNEGNDTLTGGSGTDYLYGGTGNDRITAGVGSDSVSLDDLDAGDFIDGGEGNDLLTLSVGTSTAPVVLTGGQLFLGGTLVGIGFESFNITAGAADDTLMGGSGDDVLAGEEGNDVLCGAVGADEFCYQARDLGVAETDLILDFELNVDMLALYDVSIASIEAANLEGDEIEDSLVLLSSGTMIGLVGVSGVTADELT